MKVASTIIKSKDGWVCLACGENIQEQKLALKKMLDTCGPGGTKIMCLTNGRQPATRKQIEVPADVAKAYAEAQKAVAKDQAEKAKALKKLEAEAQKAVAEAAADRKAVSDKINKRK